MAVGVPVPLVRQGVHKALVQFRTKELLRRIDLAEFTAIRLMALRYTNETRRLMRQSPRGGRVYIINGRRHRSSAPGEPPAILTRTLYRAIGFLLEKGPSGWRADAGVRVAPPPPGKTTAPHRYAWFLEFGTRKMRPRPAWRPALLNVRDKLRDIMRLSGVALARGTVSQALTQSEDAR